MLIQMTETRYLLRILAELDGGGLHVVSAASSANATNGKQTLYCRLSSSSRMEILIPLGVCAVYRWISVGVAILDEACFSTWLILADTDEIVDNPWLPFVTRDHEAFIWLVAKAEVVGSMEGLIVNEFDD